ncbi:MAG: hypothetical protein ACMXYL_05465 [Candidatus Woesearchaeota archaeon]
MGYDTILSPNGISRDDEREYAKSLQFMGYDTAILFLHNPQTNNEFPMIKLYKGVLLDKNNKRNNTGLPCMLDATGLSHDDIISIVKKTKADIITNIMPLSNNKKIMQYPPTVASESFYKEIYNRSIILSYSPSILKSGLLGHYIYEARIAQSAHIPIMLSSNAYNHYDIRSSHDIRALASVLEIKEDYYKMSLGYASRIPYYYYNDSFGIEVERKI